ncbi:uncharacterized protein PADG_07218 [Paracoccidioides brasiliensis Pb18]|uniref:Uncharacterized protein n=1 Tax=Paracoccidioides brasiliensis (strain Pb18) TaxID=502780 RepID=C1GIY2_PARBD|nr:uncharacterized protein PADG_07218 [Paracoccidioides brasiliensis Pb18]EEH42398.2 hypothetical protein PADG_07218 [Paracoccidioides brasiliensis Pb18]
MKVSILRWKVAADTIGAWKEHHRGYHARNDQWHLTWRAPCLRASNSGRALAGLPGYKVAHVVKIDLPGFGALLASPKSLANRRRRLCGLRAPRSKAYVFIKILCQREPQLDFWLVPNLGGGCLYLELFSAQGDVVTECRPCSLSEKFFPSPAFSIIPASRFTRPEQLSKETSQDLHSSAQSRSGAPQSVLTINTSSPSISCQLGERACHERPLDDARGLQGSPTGNMVTGRHCSAEQLLGRVLIPLAGLNQAFGPDRLQCTESNRSGECELESPYRGLCELEKICSPLDSASLRQPAQKFLIYAQPIKASM